MFVVFSWIVAIGSITPRSGEARVEICLPYDVDRYTAGSCVRHVRLLRINDQGAYPIGMVLTDSNACDASDAVKGGIVFNRTVGGLYDRPQYSKLRNRGRPHTV